MGCTLLNVLIKPFPCPCFDSFSIGAKGFRKALRWKFRVIQFISQKEIEFQEVSIKKRSSDAMHTEMSLHSIFQSRTFSNYSMPLHYPLKHTFERILICIFHSHGISSDFILSSPSYFPGNWSCKKICHGCDEAFIMQFMLMISKKVLGGKLKPITSQREPLITPG